MLHHPGFSGVPNKGDKIKAGSKEGGNATSPLHSRGYPTKGTKSKVAQKRAELLHHPGFSGIPNKREKIKAGPKEGGNTTSPLHSRGSPTNETKSKGAEKSSERLHHPCILGGPQQTRQNQSGPKRGRKCHITPALSGVSNKGEKIKAGSKEGGNATSPLHSRGSPTNETKSKWAQMRAKMLHHARILEAPQQRGQNQSKPKRGRKCYITAAFLGVPNKRHQIKVGPKVGGNATSPLHSRGSLSKGTKSKLAEKPAEKRAEMLHHVCIIGGPQQRGEKSKRAQKRAEMLHDPCILGAPQQRGQNQSRPKRGRKCYITPTFSPRMQG